MTHGWWYLEPSEFRQEPLPEPPTLAPGRPGHWPLDQPCLVTDYWDCY